MESTIVVILISLLLSAFFSGGEMAFISSNKLVLELNRKKHPRISKIIDVFLAKPGILIATILVGNNIALVVYSLELGNLLSPFISQFISANSTIVLLMQTIVSTVIIIIVAEFLPKTLIQFNSTAMLNFLALPLMFFFILLYPIGKLMQGLSHFVLAKVFKIKGISEDESDFLPGRVDLDNLLQKQTEQQIDENNELISQEAKLMKNALDFSKIRIRDCAIPRTDIVGIEVNDSVEKLQKTFIQSGYSKILVYKESIDNIIGYVHVSDMFKNPQKVRNMMYPILVVPETMAANTLLKSFTEQHKSIALVVDEFGGTAGIITLEDVLEEIFGEINDEHDIPEYIEKKIADGEYLFAGRLEIDYVNEKYNLKLPVSDEYETIAGLILWYSKSIPKVGDNIEFDGLKFNILAASNSRIEQVKLFVEE